MEDAGALSGTMFHEAVVQGELQCSCLPHGDLYLEANFHFRMVVSFAQSMVSVRINESNRL